MNSLSPSTLAAVAGVTALVGAFKGLTSSLKGVLDNYAHFEKLEMGLTTFFQDADKGKAKFEELRKLSNETTFGVDELTDSFTQLANVGVNVDTIQNKLTMLGDLAQGDKAKFAELTSIYAKINSVGKAGAMQLQQIASRGIPIYDMLKKIGVQGTATADDITRAFEQMTEEGGQFYNAMNNINETIEGKEGFISDYFKEFTVNFAEVTGLADAYKNILDSLKGAIGFVSDLLLKLNENPFLKAIITGAFSAILLGLVAVIGVSLVSALNVVITKLGIIATLKTLITGPTGMIALGVAGITALVAGLASFSRSAEQAEKDQEALNKKLREAQDLAHQGSNPVSNSRDSQLEQAQKDLEVYTKAKGKATAELQNAKKALQEYNNMIADFEKSWTSESGMSKEEWVNDNLWAVSLAGDNASKEDIEANIKHWENSVNSANTLLDQTRNKITKLKEEIANFGDTDELKANFESVYESLFKAEKEQATLQEQLAKIKMYRDQGGKYNNAGQLVTFDNDTKIAIDNTIRYLENKLKGVNAWEDIFKSVTGIEVPKIGSNGKTRGQLAGEAYTTRTDKLYDAQVKAKLLLGGNESDVRKSVASDFVKNIEKQIESLISNIDIDQPFEETDATIKALNAELEKYKGIVKETGEAQTEAFTSLSDLSAKLMEYAKENGSVSAYAGAKMINAVQGTAVGAAAEGAMEGSVAGPWGALIGAILGLLFTMEHWQDFLDELDTVVEPLKPALDAIINLLISATKVFEGTVEPLEQIMIVVGDLINIFAGVLRIAGALTGGLSKMFNILNPILQVLDSVLKPIVEGLEEAVAEIEEFFGLTKQTNDEKEKELEKLRALNGAYTTMKETLEDLQKEYEIRKRNINAQGYADSVTGVHDMILTPQGRFSTDPDDYIIATKNPSGLNKGGKGDIIINNYSNAQVEAKQDDMGNTVIMISQKVAMDFAHGNNGWDSAIRTRQAMSAGRTLAM